MATSPCENRPSSYRPLVITASACDPGSLVWTGTSARNCPSVETSIIALTGPWRFDSNLSSNYLLVFPSYLLGFCLLCNFFHTLKFFSNLGLTHGYDFTKTFAKVKSHGSFLEYFFSTRLKPCVEMYNPRWFPNSLGLQISSEILISLRNESPRILGVHYELSMT